MNDEWFKKAACKGMDNSIFFVERGHNTLEAKRICKTCSVVKECLVFSLKFPSDEDQYGVYGGMAPKERKSLRKKLRAMGEL